MLVGAARDDFVEQPAWRAGEQRLARVAPAASAKGEIWLVADAPRLRSGDRDADDAGRWDGRSTRLGSSTGCGSFRWRSRVGRSDALERRSCRPRDLPVALTLAGARLNCCAIHKLHRPNPRANSPLEISILIVSERGKACPRARFVVLLVRSRAPARATSPSSWTSSPAPRTAATIRPHAEGAAAQVQRTTVDHRRQQHSVAGLGDCLGEHLSATHSSIVFSIVATSSSSVAQAIEIGCTSRTQPTPEATPT